MPVLPQPQRLSLHDAINYVAERCKCEIERAGKAVHAALGEGTLRLDAHLLVRESHGHARVDAGIGPVPSELWVEYPWPDFRRRAILPRGNPMYRERTADGQQVGPVYSHPTIATTDIDIWLDRDGGNYKVSVSATTEEKGLTEWISAASALALLGMNYWLGTRTICKRAHAGLIHARAERFIHHDGRVFDNFDIPAKFWWAEGGAALDQNWTTGDFETWIDHRFHLRAFGVTFRRSEIEQLSPAPVVEYAATTPAKALEERQNMTPAGQKVFIGHGHSHIWHVLKEFLQETLFLTVDEFNSVSTAGVATANRLEEMLNDAAFAFLILTAEDEQADGTRRARENVVHEAGLFQGKLSFKKAIILLEETCEEFSNIHGLNPIRFPKDNIRAAFEDIRQVLVREKLVASQPKPGGGLTPGGKPERKRRLTYTHPRK
jgi:predicted nucleotide-binding protein